MEEFNAVHGAVQRLEHDLMMRMGSRFGTSSSRR
jgi:hypothetical protein